MKINNKQALLWWAFVGAMFALAAVLGVLQYRWIGEVSQAERQRLRAVLQSSLARLSQDFNAEITAACSALLPDAAAGDRDREKIYGARVAQWRESTRHDRLFRRIAVAVPEANTVELWMFDFSRNAFSPAEWPPTWKRIRERLTARLAGEPGGPRRVFGGPAETELATLAIPRMQFPPPEAAEPMRRERPVELDWLVVELDLEYIRAGLIPELLQRHLGAGGVLEYQVEVTPRNNPAQIIYHSDPDSGQRIGNRADASVYLFELQWEQMMRRFFPRMPGFDRLKGPPRPGPGGERGQWQMLVRHKSGSLETLVARTRIRNLAISTAVLVLMLMLVGALLRFTRRAQRLAELQMEFVANVSHELRTPLSVISSAAYNLQGGVVNDPQKVQRYGELIRTEGERLKEMVEQVLRFAGLKANARIDRPEPVPVAPLIEEAIREASRVLKEAQCEVERDIPPDLPPLTGDPVALRHVLQNLLTNAAKYGGDGRWIGISAAVESGDGGKQVVIRVRDKGQGIPPDEMKQIFDPFFRGRTARQDQIHGSGLGLSLAKRIVEAHRGKIAVRSAVGQGAEFSVSLPAGEPEQWDEFANSAD